jgi:hypothetical protein
MTFEEVCPDGAMRAAKAMSGIAALIKNLKVVWRDFMTLTLLSSDKKGAGGERNWKECAALYHNFIVDWQ